MQEYLVERNKISAAYSELESRLEEISSFEQIERTITDKEFIQQATAFIIAKKLSGSSYINYRHLASSTDTELLKDFFNSILDCTTLNSHGRIGSIVFKNGLRHTFLYSE